MPQTLNIKPEQVAKLNSAIKKATPFVSAASTFAPPHLQDQTEMLATFLMEYTTKVAPLLTKAASDGKIDESEMLTLAMALLSAVSLATTPQNT
jgi:hypothetical protein